MNYNQSIVTLFHSQAYAGPDEVAQAELQPDSQLTSPQNGGTYLQPGKNNL